MTDAIILAIVLAVPLLLRELFIEDRDFVDDIYEGFENRGEG